MLRRFFSLDTCSLFFRFRHGYIVIDVIGQGSLTSTLWVVLVGPINPGGHESESMTNQIS